MSPAAAFTAFTTILPAGARGFAATPQRSPRSPCPARKAALRMAPQPKRRRNAETPARHGHCGIFGDRAGTPSGRRRAGAVRANGRPNAGAVGTWSQAILVLAS